MTYAVCQEPNGDLCIAVEESEDSGGSGPLPADEEQGAPIELVAIGPTEEQRAQQHIQKILYAQAGLNMLSFSAGYLFFIVPSLITLTGIFVVQNHTMHRLALYIWLIFVFTMVKMMLIVSTSDGYIAGLLVLHVCFDIEQLRRISLFMMRYRRGIT